MPELPLIARARSHAGSVAFRTATTAHTYQNLLDRSATLAAALLGEEKDLNETRVALLVSPGFEYAAAQWAIWRAGGIKVPICLSATPPEWEYALKDSGAGILMADAAMATKISPLCERLGVRLVNIDSITAAPAKNVAGNFPGTSRDDSLHQRHDEQTQGRRDHAREHPGAD